MIVDLSSEDIHGCVLFHVITLRSIARKELLYGGDKIYSLNIMVRKSIKVKDTSPYKFIQRSWRALCYQMIPLVSAETDNS